MLGGVHVVRGGEGRGGEGYMLWEGYILGGVGYMLGGVGYILGGLAIRE